MVCLSNAVRGSEPMLQQANSVHVSTGTLLGIGLGLVIPFRQAWASLRPRHAFTSLRPTGS